MYITREISLQQMMKTMLISLYVILRALREGNCSNYPWLMASQSCHVRGPTLASFIGPEWQSKHSDGTLATVASIVYHDRLYTSVTVSYLVPYRPLV